MRSLAVCFVAASLALSGCGDDGGSSNPDAGAGPDASVNPDASPVTCQANVPFQWPVVTEPVTITPNGAWKNQVASADDAFLSGWSPEPIRWIKFAILMKDPSKVYFQDSSTYEFHYDFASQYLNPFVGLSRAQFDEVSLREQGQEVVLGALLIPQAPGVNEIGIQLVRHDPYHPEMVRTLVELVKANVTTPAGTNIFYMPTFEQSESAQACADWYDNNNINLSSVDRWLTENSCYANGWGIGRLVFVPATGIDAAYQAGTLKSTDILLTDGIPAEVPYVAGILTTTPTTPNSHVAILARSYGVPFAHLADDAQAAAAQALVGKDVLLRAYAGFETCNVRVTDVNGQIPGAELTALLDLKSPPDLSIQAIAPLGSYSRSVTGLTSSDVRYFGGKATNFAVLRAAIPNNSPNAVALSFDLWTEFLNQTMASTNTLRADIAARLGGFTYPPNIAAVETALIAVRDMIKNQATFTTAHKNAITTAITGFDANRKLRFRSSTNVEDTEHFVGAGLYDSYSGCRADDEDSDEVGPSVCDPSKATERGVLRAIKKVYASFYNTNAFLERLRYGVDESKVGMAVLVHYSFPDENEQANGVATTTRSQWSTGIELVTQKGAHSVANPTGGATPEEVSVYVNGSNIYPDVIQGSSLVPLGDTVMSWPTDYEDLSRLLVDVGDEYHARNPGLNETFTLDLEYKKVDPNNLVVKQVRRLPVVDPDARWPTYLVNDPKRYCVWQIEFGDAFSNHRLKSEWMISTASRWTNATTLATSFYTDIGLQYLEGTNMATLSGTPSSWANASHTYDGDKVFDNFSIGTGPSRRDYSLMMSVPVEVRKTESPVRTLDDHYKQIEVNYATAQPIVDWMGAGTTTTDYAVLGPCTADNVVTGDNPKHSETITAGGITVDTAYWWPKPPTGAVAGYTAPLYKWDKTTITGLTTTPIVLTGDYSQTYRPGHHNFSNDYIFDPWLEPGISVTTLNELQAANIRLLFIEQTANIWVLTLDGQLQQRK